MRKVSMMLEDFGFIAQDLKASQEEVNAKLPWI
jgi:hypothetical protein